ncbi:MAG: hypothetical protein IJ744_11510 [Lachnospiraceae bacterium]|nr:hypothetical protein [Lachnospiraceae bacterium]
MLNIDTERLGQSLKTLNHANDAIDEACRILSKVTTHQDWGCKERTQLNRYIEEYQKSAKKLKKRTENFVKATKDATRKFEQSEKDIAKLFPSVDDAIAKALSGGFPTMTSNSPAGNVNLQGLGTGLKTDFMKNVISGKWNASSTWAGLVESLSSSSKVQETKKVISQLFHESASAVTAGNAELTVIRLKDIEL